MRRLGWRLVTVHRGAVAAARRLKPEIPDCAADGTPIADELEYECRLDIAEQSHQRRRGFRLYCTSSILALIAGVGLG